MIKSRWMGNARLNRLKHKKNLRENKKQLNNQSKLQPRMNQMIKLVLKILRLMLGSRRTMSKLFLNKRKHRLPPRSPLTQPTGPAKPKRRRKTPQSLHL